jgi:hypothetical protein
MIDFGKIVHSKQTVPFLSFLIGLGLSVLFFHKPYTSKKYLSIPVSKIEGKVVKHDDKCYTYRSKDVKCEEEVRTNSI